MSWVTTARAGWFGNGEVGWKTVRLLRSSRLTGADGRSISDVTALIGPPRSLQTVSTIGGAMERSIARRLGYHSEDRLLIVNCDDLGSSHCANVAAFKAVTHGIATSASLMVPCPWAAEAANMFKGLPVGIHLTLTSEHPGYRWRSLTGAASLRDIDGLFPATTAAAVREQNADDVRAECHAQIAAALAWGVDVTHLDSHMDVLHASADLFTIYLDLADEFALPVRLPLRADYPARKMADTRGILSTDHLIYHWPRPTRDVVVEECATLRGGVTELFAHPASDGEELRGYDPHHADIRAHDAATLTDPELVALLDGLGVRRISHRELRDAQRGGGNWSP